MMIMLATPLHTCSFPVTGLYLDLICPFFRLSQQQHKQTSSAAELTSVI